MKGALKRFKIFQMKTKLNTKFNEISSKDPQNDSMIVLEKTVKIFLISGHFSPYLTRV